MSRSFSQITTMMFLVVFAFLLGPQIIQSFNSMQWPEVSGKVVGTRIVPTYGGRYRTRYAVKVDYVYVIQHVSYEGETRLRDFYLQSEAQSWVQTQYWHNQGITVYYNPNNHKDSTITRGNHLASLSIWFLLLLALVLFNAGRMSVPETQSPYSTRISY